MINREQMPHAVILNFNLKDDTIECINSLFQAGVPLTRIIVVDNGSLDGSVEALGETFGHALHVISNPANQGFAAGMNIGIQYALHQGAASVLILNNDTVIDSQMVETLVDAGQRLQAADILAPAIFYHDTRDRIWRLGDRRIPFLPMPLTVRTSTNTVVNMKPFRVDYVTGCGMLVRRQVFDQIGFFDTRYFMYGEDADFCARAGEAGFGVWCVPQAKMWHKVSLTARREKALNRYHRVLGQVRFLLEHPHGPSRILRHLYIVAKSAMLTIRDVFKLEWKLILPSWRGVRDGYREQWRRKD
jgi:GT2 family glycosyltransferase